MARDERDDRDELQLLVKRGWRDLSRRPKEYKWLTDRMESYFRGSLPEANTAWYRILVREFLLTVIRRADDDLQVREALQQLLGLKHGNEDISLEVRRRLAFEASGPRQDGEPHARPVDGRWVQRHLEAPLWYPVFLRSAKELPALSPRDGEVARRRAAELALREEGGARPPPRRSPSPHHRPLPRRIAFDADRAAQQLDGAWRELVAQQFEHAGARLRRVLYDAQLPRYPRDAEIELRAKANLYYGHLLRDTGRLSAAAWHYDKALAMFHALDASFSIAHARLMSAVVLEMGAGLKERGLADATRAYTDLCQQFADLSQGLATHGEHAHRLAELNKLRAQTFLASTLSKRGQFDDAIPLLRETRRVLTGDHDTDYVTTTCKLATALSAAGGLDEAFAVVADLRQSGRLLESSDLHRARVDLVAASLHLRAGDLAQGGDLLHHAEQMIEAGDFGHLRANAYRLRTGRLLIVD